MVGIRTATHAFGKRGETEGAWETFDMACARRPLRQSLRARCQGVREGGARCRRASGAEWNFWRGVRGPVASLQVSQARSNRDAAHRGAIGRDGPEIEPVAWVNVSGQRRAFYTLMGAAEDFVAPQFRRLLLNGIHWALGLPAPK